MTLAHAGAGPPVETAAGTGARTARPRTGQVGRPDVRLSRQLAVGSGRQRRRRRYAPAPPVRRAERPPADRGAVTAETAVALPSVLLVTLMLVWLLTVVTAQLQCVDAARAGARVVSRGESVAASEAAALQAAPEGATVTISRAGDFVRVEVGVEVEAVGGLIGFLPSVHVDAVAHALAEDAVADGRRTAGGVLRAHASQSAAAAAPVDRVVR